jgi:hypothetical protein
VDERRAGNVEWMNLEWMNVEWMNLAYLIVEERPFRAA